MKFSREFLDTLKERVDLLDLASEYTEMKKAGPDIYVGHCPHPNHRDSDASFCVNTLTQTWCCFGCHSDKKDKQSGNFGSDAIAFLEWVNEGKMSWIDCVTSLADRVQLPLPKEKNEKEFNRNYKLAMKYLDDLQDDAYEYLLDRGITDEAIFKWSIGYDKSENRIVFPLYDSYKNIVGFNKRLITKETKGLNRKYVHSSNSEIFNKSQYFYGMQYIDNSKDYIILTEGVFDVILPQIYGVSNTICALGTTLSDYQINVLAKQNKKVIVVYDNDKKGIDTLKKIMPLLEENGITAKLLLLPEGKDLADITLELKEDILNYILKECISYSYYLIQNAINEFNKELFELYVKYDKLFIELKDSIPESERAGAEAFLNTMLRKPYL